ncbi:unnamed protein product [Rhizoctonia solani]|uniref:Uncharacterized protein n=2 Tax=Rhizoctonia solani TaxID=456999 RepID=A0A8H3DDJ0_9AGAM
MSCGRGAARLAIARLKAGLLKMGLPGVAEVWAQGTASPLRLRASSTLQWSLDPVWPARLIISTTTSSTHHPVDLAEIAAATPENKLNWASQSDHHLEIAARGQSTSPAPLLCAPA